MSIEPSDADVLVIGGGPTGLLTAYALQRMNISTCVVERLDKDNMPMYGRASTLFSRTLEFLDQLGLIDEFTQMGLIARGSVNFKDGKRVTSRGWNSIFQQMGETYHNYALNIRLKHSERLIQDAYEKLGGRVATRWELRDLSWGEADEKGYRVSATVGVVDSTMTKIVKSKYLVGADGGSSAVRRLSNIAFPQDHTTYTWVRIDGIVKTNMPESRMGFGSLESRTHGNVLWVSMDHGTARIGFSLNEELIKKYGRHLTREQAITEAKASMAPFDLEFETVDWHTTYSIRQAVAERFVVDDCIFVAGDAAHIHSSGAAQGMNTGVHDAVNLAWKLGGVLRGWYAPSVVRAYHDERRAAALRLIDLDRTYSALISGYIPAHLPQDQTANELLSIAYDAAIPFNIGLGVHYPESALVRAAESGTAIAGWRAPDGLLYAPGPHVPRRLHALTPNFGACWLVVFAGEPAHTAAALRGLRAYVDAPAGSFARWVAAGAVRLLTVIAGTKVQGDEALGVNSFGKYYYDPDLSVHARYGFSAESGGIAVLRPDSILGYATELSAYADVESYLSGFVNKPAVNGTATNGA